VTDRRSPNLFLVGVQRSATTALCRYLAQHPELFMARKELHYFGSDLSTCRGQTDSYPRLTLDQYLSYFDAAGDERYRGDASVGYVYSRKAAAEIAAFCPDARIIVSFRNPVDMLYSTYSLLRFQGIETAERFEDAVFDSENPRWAYTATHFRWGFTYPGLVSYSEGLERYLDAFGSANVHVLLYEDFVSDAPGEYRKVLQFLGVDTTFEATMQPVFSNRRTRSRLLHRLLFEPPPLVRSLGRRLVASQSKRRRMGRTLTERNVRVAPRRELDPELRKSLEERFSPEAARLGRLLGRDMSALWWGASSVVRSP
jgi:hypothetical protein